MFNFFYCSLYSLSYLGKDPHLCRFISYLSLFTFFMEILVTADNLIQLFFGWEGVGLCSYLLINFWYSRILANKAALKAMIMNRIADVFLILAVILIIIKLKVSEYIIIFDLITYIQNDFYYILGYNINILSLISFLIFIGAIGKSAQIGFHT